MSSSTLDEFLQQAEALSADIRELRIEMRRVRQDIQASNAAILLVEHLRKRLEDNKFTNKWTPYDQLAFSYRAAQILFKLGDWRDANEHIKHTVEHVKEASETLDARETSLLEGLLFLQQQCFGARPH